MVYFAHVLIFCDNYFPFKTLLFFQEHVHENPMFVRIAGVVLKEQLGGDTMIDHELMSVIIHRCCQADQEADEELPHLTWRHPLEPDYSVREIYHCDLCK